MTALVPIWLPSTGSITVVDQDGAHVLQLVGEIDAETVAAYQRAGSSPARIDAVDLEQVTFLSSSAVSFLVRQTKPIRELGQLPPIVGVSDHARRVLELLGVTRLFAPLTV
jgi:anti-anti-sigma factor